MTSFASKKTREKARQRAMGVFDSGPAKPDRCTFVAAYKDPTRLQHAEAAELDWTTGTYRVPSQDLFLDNADCGTQARPQDEEDPATFSPSRQKKIGNERKDKWNPNTIKYVHMRDPWIPLNDDQQKRLDVLKGLKPSNETKPLASHSGTAGGSSSVSCNARTPGMTTLVTHKGCFETRAWHPQVQLDDHPRQKGKVLNPNKFYGSTSASVKQRPAREPIAADASFLTQKSQKTSPNGQGVPTRRLPFNPRDHSSDNDKGTLLKPNDNPKENPEPEPATDDTRRVDAALADPQGTLRAYQEFIGTHRLDSQMADRALTKKRADKKKQTDLEVRLAAENPYMKQDLSEREARNVEIAQTKSDDRIRDRTVHFE